ncbi:cell division protein FtsQ/DivIB [Sphingomonas sp. KR1UV-12]|uniref:Cell division protein FtsQ n=1 Tax=Sphingomonas aurea TaxID=3063994 RepID=A0ABT9EFT4_9SPHN|nr:cell division protein FtsQ/DivIB [Sphingomonas sp. KR1UV-12]MDP1025636.1 cell division protein FtsQ/DivIB [Sphingomonas sp. KR1UV-12]
MSRTIRRGAPPKRPAPRRRQPAKKVSMIDRLVTRLPVSEQTLRRAVTWTITGAVGVGAVVAAGWLGVPAMVGAALAETAGQAGLRVQQIEITGLKRMDRMTVYAVALDQQTRAMPLVDLEDVRQKLLRYGWIADAHVSRRLPDTLLIDIVERTPAAVWQDRGELTLIDASGVLLEPVRADAIPDLPLIIGPGADRQEASYQSLLAAAPALKPRIRAATWIGNRRWDLTFDSGEVLALPEEEAPRALVRFAELDGARPLLGRGWLRFDMRDPAKLVARKPGLNQNHALAEPAQIGAGAEPATTGNGAPGEG